MAKQLETNVGEQNDLMEGQQGLQALNKDDLLFGLPPKVFWGGVATTLAFGFILKSVWYLSIVWMFVYFVAAFAMHEDNPKAARSWIKALRQPTRWQARSFRYKSLNLINKDQL